MKKIAEKITEFSTTKRLIEAMADYALEYAWSDNDLIEALENCGITQQDFIDCGYGNFVKKYYNE